MQKLMDGRKKYRLTNVPVDPALPYKVGDLSRNIGGIYLGCVKSFASDGRCGNLYGFDSKFLAGCWDITHALDCAELYQYLLKVQKAYPKLKYFWFH